MIDPNIIARGTEQAQLQQQRNMEAFGDLGGNLGQLVLGRRINQMQQLKNPEEQQAFANNSIFAPLLNRQLQADNTAQSKAYYDQLKAEADIAKTSSEAYKNNQQGQGYGLDNSGKALDAIHRAISHSAATGDKQAALTGLERLANIGFISPEQYKTEAANINAFTNPEDFKKYATGMLDPKYWHQTGDNFATNETTQRGQTLNYNLGQDKLEQEGKQYQQNFEYKAQQDEIKNGQAEVKEFGGKSWIVYKNGDYKPFIDVDGKQVMSKNFETPVQKMERQEKLLGYADSARSAAEASKLAAKLANDLDGINSAAGGWGVMAKIPGTDARNFTTQIDTLQSQVFLNQIAKMKGMGALTDAEGQRLATSIANLDINLEPKQLQANLTEIAKAMSKAAVKANKIAQIYKGNQQQNSQQPNMFGFFD